MKKTLFTLAIAVVVAAVVSCTNKTGEGNEANDSTAVEQSEEPEKEVAIEDRTELTCANYTVKVPEGFKARSRMVNNSCNMGFKEAPFTTIALNCTSSSIEDMTADAEKQKAQKLDDISGNGITYSVYYGADNNGYQFIYMLAPKGDGTMTIRLYEGASQMDKAESKEVLLNQAKLIAENVTFK